MVRPVMGAWVRRLMLAAAVVGAGGMMAAKPADAQISLQLPFVSLGIGPAYYPYYGYYGYPYYHRAYYGWGWRHRCHWWHHHCHYY